MQKFRVNLGLRPFLDQIALELGQGPRRDESLAGR